MEGKCPDENLRMRGTNPNLCILRMLEDTFFLARPILYAFCFGLNIFYCKITMSIQTYMAYTQKIGLERKHKLI